MDEPAKRAAALSPASRARFIFLLRSWGLRPRLYAFVRFADFNTRCLSGFWLILGAIAQGRFHQS
jgi:hypothetical protein